MGNSIKPNILFLLVDSFRSDKCYGKEKTSVTPNLDALIEQGTYFLQAISSAPVTIPSISSILTARFPFKSVMSGGSRLKLNSRIPTFVYSLKNLGYNTIALTPEILSLSGLTNDFTNNLTFPRHNGLNEGVGDQILNVFESEDLKEPWFFYIHLLDIHGTARGFPEKFDQEKYGMNQYERMVSSMDIWFGRILKKIKLEKTIVVLTADHGNDAGIYTPEMEKGKEFVHKDDSLSVFSVGKKFSSKLPKLLYPLKSKMRKIYLDNKNKAKTEKKQEKLEEIKQQNLSPYMKRILERSINPSYDVFDDRFHVPLLFAGFGIQSNLIIKQQVRSIDIFPTIMELINFTYENMVDGKSLLPLINAQSYKEIPAYMESTANWTKSKTTDVVGIRYQGFKYFRSRNHSKEKIGLYNLLDDPLEETNLVNKMPEKIIKMEKILSEIRKDAPEEFEKESEDQKDLEENRRAEEELKKLGYL